MMKKMLAPGTLALALSAPSLAQTSSYAASPVAGEKGHVAAGFGGGVTFPFESGTHVGWLLDGSFDYYVSRLFAVRGTAAYTHASTDFTDAFTKASFLGSAVFQFDHRALRPYVLGGLGLYAVSPPVGSTRARLGIHAGGGVEWFFGLRTALTGEAVLHLLPSAEDRSTSSIDVAFGVRQYF